MEKLIIATNNRHKAKEIKAILGGFYKEVLSLKDADVNIEVEEDGTTFHENAAKKAVEISKLVDCDVLADDSGLCADALDGAPGVYSARFSGEGATDEANNAKLLALMSGAENRNARFVCALVLANGGKEILYAEDCARGVLLDAPRGNNGFGYDPLFLDEERQQTFAELPAEIKNRISHRARALALLRSKIEKLRR